jgi:hypothetical protein
MQAFRIDALDATLYDVRPQVGRYLTSQLSPSIS